MAPETPVKRPRLPWWLPAFVLVPVLGLLALTNLNDPTPVDLYTEDVGNAVDEDVAQAASLPAETVAPVVAQAAPADPEAAQADPVEPAAPSSDQSVASASASGAANAGPTESPAAAETAGNDPGVVPPVPITSTPGVDGVVADTAAASPAQTGSWCEIEVRATDGVIRWEDEGRTAVFRRNDSWYHTPDEAAVAILVPEEIDTDDEYILRLWNGGTSDVLCTFVAGTSEVAAPASTTTTTAPAPTTTTTVPEAVAFAALPDPIAIPAGPVQMGFNVDLWGDERTAYWSELEAVPGNGRLIAHEFKSFTKTLNTSILSWHMSEGRDVLLTWNGTTASSILDGSQDALIRSHAQQLSALPGTVKLRFWHEPDVSYKASWIEGDPQNYIDAWMYVRRLFVEEGAVSNIEWVWCPTAWNWEQQGALFYPGDANVDWICADGYSGMNLDKPLDPIADEFTAFQAWADQRPSKPILIAEFGATERDPGDRAAWVQGIPTWVNASSNIRAVVYFDYDKRSEQPWDWRLRTEADAWDAMKDVLSSAPFGN